MATKADKENGALEDKKAILPGVDKSAESKKSGTPNADKKTNQLKSDKKGSQAKPGDKKSVGSTRSNSTDKKTNVPRSRPPEQKDNKKPSMDTVAKKKSPVVEKKPVDSKGNCKENAESPNNTKSPVVEKQLLDNKGDCKESVESPNKVKSPVVEKQPEDSKGDCKETVESPNNAKSPVDDSKGDCKESVESPNNTKSPVDDSKGDCKESVESPKNVKSPVVEKQAVDSKKNVGTESSVTEEREADNAQVKSSVIDKQLPQDTPADCKENAESPSQVAEETLPEKVDNEENLSRTENDISLENNATENESLGNAEKNKDLLKQDEVGEKVNSSQENVPASVNGETDECTLFHHITYLGCAAINAPRSEVEIQRNMSVLNEQSASSVMEITVSIPHSSTGFVILKDPDSEMEIVRFPIHRILFCAKGMSDSREAACFAFTCSRGDTQESAIYQCHAFRCNVHEASFKMLQCFGNAFRRTRSAKNAANGLPSKQHCISFIYEVTLEIKEDDGKGNFSSVPKDKNAFKLRCNMDKQLLLTVQQVSEGPKILDIERCFGLLVSPGRNVKDSDMQLIEMISTKVSNSERKMFSITGLWDPTESHFQLLNEETPKDMRVFMTVAVDLVMMGIQQPVRFVIETRARVFPQGEKFWYFTRKVLTQQFTLRLKEGDTPLKYVVQSIETTGEMDRNRMTLPLSFASISATAIGGYVRSPSISSGPGTPNDYEEDSGVVEFVRKRITHNMNRLWLYGYYLYDNEEPLLSGSGEVSKDCTKDKLELWQDVLVKWRSNLAVRPKALIPLVRDGIPEALRGEVWQLLAGCVVDSNEIMESYRILITKDCPSEPTILRDINRTFPAHDFFKDSGGLGQDSLYKISKAYAVWDEEIGYCQGLSFLAASLLLHMPEEQAFCVLVKIMFDYSLRDLFKDDLEILHLRFYQLDRLIEEQIPELGAHLQDLGVESHMFASQWFLTLFTAKFPLPLVFHILDLFLLQGFNTIFQVAMALLKMSRKELLALDFEGVLKYFRVSLPKKYRSEEQTRQLMQHIIATKVKKLSRYEKEYITQRENERLQEDPATRLERENRQLRDANLRLETENGDLAHQLINTELHLKSRLDQVIILHENITKELHATKTVLHDTEEEKRRLQEELHQVKELMQKEIQRLDTDVAQKNNIVSEYKQICSQLSQRLEKEQSAYKKRLEEIKAAVKGCEVCSKAANAEAEQVLPVTEGTPTSPPTDTKITNLELELAQTKLALVEAECKNQDLTHQMNTLIQEIQANRNSTWFQKTLTSLREVAAVKRDQSRENLKELT